MQKIRLEDLALKGSFRQFRLVESGPVYVQGYAYADGYECWLLNPRFGRVSCSRVLPSFTKVFEVPMAF